MRSLKRSMGRTALGTLTLAGGLGLAAVTLSACRTEVVVEERHPRREVIVEEQPVMEVRVREAPPPPRREYIVECPGPRSEWFWIGGHWQWNGRQWVWYGGHWHRIPPQRRVYVSGVWRVHADGGYFWVGGHWD